MISLTQAQEVERIIVSGKISVKGNDDIAGVTIYNTYSKQGTATNDAGKFEIAVALNDIIEVRSLQFEDYLFTINQKIIESRQLTIMLVEQVNQLKEIVILPYDLTGNLIVDSGNVKTFDPDRNAIEYGIKHLDEYEFDIDHKTAVENNVMHSQSVAMKNGLNVANILKLMASPLTKNKKTKAEKRQEKVDAIPVNVLTEEQLVNGKNFLSENYNIPQDAVDEFIIFLRNNGFDQALLEPGKEFELLEFIGEKSKLFLNNELQKN
ncbi:MAG: hypothetical protein BM564_10980 [Bacteroidetes bacterium MedPE-SWsnd-G2]|nr:MAG: hypothetical protein BM564_10980 [Bacteroidetes bacterium MedPE-SWsnd-G2]